MKEGGAALLDSPIPVYEVLAPLFRLGSHYMYALLWLGGAASSPVLDMLLRRRFVRLGSRVEGGVDTLFHTLRFSRHVCCSHPLVSQLSSYFYCSLLNSSTSWTNNNLGVGKSLWFSCHVFSALAIALLVIALPRHLYA